MDKVNKQPKVKYIPKHLDYVPDGYCPYCEAKPCQGTYNGCEVNKYRGVIRL